MSEKITVFTSDMCETCREVKEMIQNGDVISDYPVELVPIETPEGNKRFQEEVVSRGERRIQIPIAFKGQTRCDIQTDTERPGKIILSCPC